MKIELPWPPRELRPRYRQGWRSIHDFKVKYRSDCFYIAKQHNTVFSKQVNIPLSITFHPPSKHKFDLDNCLGSIKFGLDSVAKAFGVDDRQFRPLIIDMGEQVKGGKVVIKVHTPANSKCMTNPFVPSERVSV